MNKIIIGIAAFILILVIFVYYLYRDPFEFKKGLDIWGNDLLDLNNEFRSKGNNSVEAAKAFALSKPQIKAFVRLNGGNYFFKPTSAGPYTQCINSGCTEPESGLYIKK